MEKLTLNELTKRSNDWKKAVIVFTEDSFNKFFTEEERSYEITSDNKYFNADMNGTSLFGNCLDGKDDGVRLDIYMSLPEEKERWEVECCYIVD